MNLALTSQEKKVLGFVIVMVGLGLVMLAIQRRAGSEVGPETPGSVPTTAVSQTP